MIRVLAVLMCAVLVAISQEALTNDAIIKLVKAGLSETVLLGMVNSQPGKYSTKVDDLIALKEAGVTDKVIAAMAAKAVSAPSPATPAGSENAVAGAAAAPTLEIGVYFKKDGSWTEVLPEVVNWKTGGALKSLATATIVKKDVNGNIAGPSSRNSVKAPLEFLLVAAEGVSVTEYQLIRLRLNKNYREFRTVTGGILNQQSGAMRDLVPFEGKRVSPRTFAVVLPSNLGAGEYGFLSPGAGGAAGVGHGGAQIGKMYTFRIVE